MSVTILPPLPPEHQAYALARYSRSADSIEKSLEYVYSHDPSKFFSQFYWSYGHASVADLGHVAICFEGISDLAAQHILGYDLIDAQCKSTRYQDFGKCAIVLPPHADDRARNLLAAASSASLTTYQQVLDLELAALEAEYPRPATMDEATYARTLRARALDVARYCLPMGIPTSLGIVCSIRTLERIASDALVDPYPEVQHIGQEIVEACARAPMERCWDPDGLHNKHGYEGTAHLQTDDQPVLPTLASHIQPNEYRELVRKRALSYCCPGFRDTSETWLEDPHCGRVALAEPGNLQAEILASLCYPHTTRSYQALMSHFTPDPRGFDLDTIVLAGLLGPSVPDAIKDRPADLPEMRAGLPFQFEMKLDHGAFRDLRRHRRCVQLRKNLTYDDLHYYRPPFPASPESHRLITKAWVAAVEAGQRIAEFDPWASHYLLPMCHGISAVFKMDLAQAMYIVKLRTGKKGHDAYRRIAWLMGKAIGGKYPHLAHYIQGTDPEERDPLFR